MSNFDSEPDFQAEARLFSKAELMLAVSGMAITGDWDAGGITKDTIRLRGLEAAADPRLQLWVDNETGMPTYGAWLSNMDLPSNDLRRGRLTLTFDGDPVAFTGIGMDLSAFDKGNYHLRPDGTLVRQNDGEEKRVGALRARLLYETVRSCVVVFTDPGLLREADL